MAEPLTLRLRRETSDCHRRLDSHPRLTALASGTIAREDYADLLASFLGFYRPLERKLSDFEAYAGRNKTPLLERDLRAMNRDPDTVPDCSALPEIHGLGSALGAIYVVEGSTLGGRIISRGLPPELARDFLRSYGERVSEMWKAMQAELTAYTGDPTEVVRTARATFESLEAWI